MATVGDVANHISTNWRTTLQGFFITVAAWAGEVAILGIKTWPEVFTLPHVCAELGALAPTVIGLIQKDAGTQLAVTPSGEKEVVASHETPDNPANIPVKS